VPPRAEPATAYLGAGPWGSLGPAIPAVPSQALEGIATGGVLLAVLLLSLVPMMRRPDGRLFAIAVGGWALVRLVVASTWRDPVIAGPLRAEQVIAAVVAVGALALALVLVVANRGRAFEASPPVSSAAHRDAERRDETEPA
jgi:prolipoprotein diacylglyceryltransferase